MTRRLKILHLYKAYAPILGGIEGNVEMLARGQAARGHAVSVLVTVDGPTTETVEHGVRVVRCRRVLELRSNPFSLSWFGRLRAERPDVTHVHCPYPFGTLTQGLLGRSRATVATYHCDIVKQRILGAFYRPLQRRFLSSTDRILVTNPRIAETSPVLSGLPTEGRVVVPLGIDLTGRAGRAAGPEKDGGAAEDGEPFALFVGRHRHYKGMPDLLRAMAHLPHRLVLVGDGPLRPSMEVLAAELGLGERARFIGSVDEDELRRLYRRAGVLVLPSTNRSEAFGLVLAEAMAAGTPVISTDVGTGTSWVNRDGETGFVVPPGAPERLAEAIGRLLGDEELRQAMGHAAQGRAEALFDAEAMVDRTIEVYRDALNLEDLTSEDLA